MNTKRKLHTSATYLCLLAFLAFTLYILYINGEVLYTAHDRSEFLYGTPFFDTLMSKPFGLMQYLGAWLTQLFCYPVVGAAVLITVWMLSFVVGVWAFRLKGSAKAVMLLPVACLLTSVVDLGYWIYISKIPGYWFSQSLGFLLMLMLLLGASRTPRRWHIVWYVLAFCLYPLLGWFALLFILCLVVAYKITWRDAAGIVLLIAAVPVWHALLYRHLRFDDAMLSGMPLFITPTDYSEYLSIPFWILGALTVLIPLTSRFLTRWYVPLISFAAGILFTVSLMFSDSNYIDEMRMVRYAESDNWKAVLEVAGESSKPTTSMIMLRNIALMNEGGLLDRSFKMGNKSYDLNNPDSLHVSMLKVAAPVIYYNYGLVNEAFRLNFENAVQTGFSPFYLKSLSRCALANGEENLSQRYTTLLRHLPFYADWQPTPATKRVSELMHSYPDEITGVENTDKYLVNSICLWHDTDSKAASEQALFYSMIRCDANCFWPSLRSFIKQHQDEDFPLHAQEAYILFIDKAPEEKRMMMPVEETVYNNYKEFWDVLKKNVRPGMRLEEMSSYVKKWKGTYWYYYLFERKQY